MKLQRTYLPCLRRSRKVVQLNDFVYDLESGDSDEETDKSPEKKTRKRKKHNSSEELEDDKEKKRPRKKKKTKDDVRGIGTFL
uniref:Uncharacterized protein n=1 Tax=Megaselia scalaris TaxID=36166 RepID=T1GEM9_MEGSC